MNQQTTLDSLGLSFPRYLPRGIYKELKQHNRPSSIIMANIRRKEEEDKKVHSSCLFCVIFCVYTIHLDSYFYFVGGNFRCRGFITLPQYSVLLQLDYTLVCVCMYVLLVLHFHHAASSIENSVQSTVPQYSILKLLLDYQPFGSLSFVQKDWYQQVVHLVLRLCVLCFLTKTA